MGLTIARLLGVVLLLCLGGSPVAWGWLRPLSPEQRRVVLQVPDEHPYPVRMHFLASNEKRHDVFFPYLVGLGGGYVGVGADQNYTLAAVARSELLWLVDIDERVVQWHRIYAALLLRAPQPADLAELLDGQRGAEVRAVLRERWGEEGAVGLWRAFQRDRWRIAAHVRREMKLSQDGQPVSWLSDPALYAHVRMLARDQRILAHIGDLHGEQTLRALGVASHAAGIPVRVFYISNVEQWFRYSAALARNLAGLLRDEHSVLLRTLARPELRAPQGDRWHFCLQSLDDFVRRLGSPAPPRRVHDLMPEMALADRMGAVPGLSLLGARRAGMGAQARSRPRPPPQRGSAALPAARPMRLSWAYLLVPF